MPVDRFAQATLWKDIMSQMARFPQLMASYDMGKIFEWVAQLAGLKNLNQFKIQVAPNQLLAQQAAQGNVVPMKGAGGGPPGPGPQSNNTTLPQWLRNLPMALSTRRSYSMAAFVLNGTNTF
jgi:hypothetical protein